MRAWALALVVAAGCASIDWDAPKTHTTARSRPPSPALVSALDAHPKESGFVLLNDGIDAFAARLLMANRAQTSIDAQYYFILDDVTGRHRTAELQGPRPRCGGTRRSLATSLRDLPVPAVSDVRETR